MLFSKIRDRLLSGDISILTVRNIINMNNFVLKMFDSSKVYFTDEELDNIFDILLMSNILYNNTDRDVIILDDGIYDLLLQLYYNHRPDDNRLVGAIPVNFENYNEQLLDIKQPVTGIVFGETDEMFFSKDITRTNNITLDDLMVKGIVFEEVNEAISKREVNMAHNYPNLVGTLSKCKFVLSKQAKDANVYDDPKVRTFERDFFGYHITLGLINMNTYIRIIVELKYDGISVEGDIVGDTLVGGRSRGDANNDIAADLTPILKGYKFPRATGTIPPDYEFGMQFEAIMTYENLKKFNILTGQEYKNCRTAISGLFSRSDAYKYRDLITLVPLRTSLDNIDRIGEIEFMNEYYTNGILMKYAILEGSYIDVLFKLKIFVDEADYMRDYLDFMYDGVVVEYLDEELINKLGRKNAINQFATAIKFNPQKKHAYVTGLTFTVGKDGVITPKIHYTPVEFIGTTHTQSTLHSYERYLTERPAIGKIADVVYVNEVMPYVNIPNNSYNEAIDDLIPYATRCPSCGSELELAESGKNWYCRNMNCKERNIRRMADFLDVLNLKNFAEATIEKLGITSLTQLLNTKIEDVAFLGETNSMKFMDTINLIKTMPIEEHKVVGGLGFTAMSYTTWEYILKVYTLRELYNMYRNSTDQSFIFDLTRIRGIGNITAATIYNEFPFFKNDIETILSMDNIIQIKGQAKKITVRFTNCRNPELVDKLNNSGVYDADDKKGVTKTTDILLIPYKNFTGPSGKYDNAVANGITQIIPIDEFINSLTF